MGRYVYLFGDGKADGDATQKELLGGKGAGLAEMTRIGVPVPPGFTITTEVAVEYSSRGPEYGLREEVRAEIREALARVEAMMGRLAGHSMFAGGEALQRLQMCADCRVVDMMENKGESSVLDYTGRK